MRGSGDGESSASNSGTGPAGQGHPAGAGLLQLPDPSAHAAQALRTGRSRRANPRDGRPSHGPLCPRPTTACSKSPAPSPTWAARNRSPPARGRGGCSTGVWTGITGADSSVPGFVKRLLDLLSATPWQRLRASGVHLTAAASLADWIPPGLNPPAPRSEPERLPRS